MYRVKAFPVAVWTILILFSCAIFVWNYIAPFGICVRGSLGTTLEKTISALDSITDLSLKLSTTLVGVGAGVLIGLKSGIALTRPIRHLLIVSALLFTQSALYSVWWRLGIANSWLNDCLNVITEAALQRRYEAQLLFFILGLISLGGLVVVAGLLPNKTET